MSKKRADKEVLASGKTTFKIEVPYELIETGRKNVAKPLMIYIHGFGDYLKSFKKTNSSLLNFEACHLFIQGPYPVYDQSGKISVSKWGRAWYLYDGKRKQFIKSLEITSEFVQEIVDNLIQFINVSRICLIGYSMGGYLAGYFALTRWKHVNELVVVGGRIKTEILGNGDWDHLSHMNILAVHGKKDKTVEPEAQEKMIHQLSSHGINAEFRPTHGGHTYGDEEIEFIANWLIDQGYSIS